MKRSWTIAGLVLLLSATGVAATRLTSLCGNCASTSNAGATPAAGMSGSACASDHAAAAGEACASGAASGDFDPVMSGVCQFSCAIQEKVDETRVVTQPGAHAGDLTRCPVSGVVFAVDAGRPTVHLASGDYVVCCGQCAGKLEKHPEKFLKL